MIAHKNSIGSFFALGIIILIPTLVLIGWVTNNSILTSVFPLLTPMNPMTATLFLLIGVALVAERLNVRKVFHRSLFYVAGTAAFVVGLLMVIKYAFDIDLFIDRILFTSKLGINRMAVTTSFNFLSLGIFMLAYPYAVRYTRWLILGVSLISIYSFIAYLYNFVGVYGTTLLNPMAIHTAIAFFVVSVYLYTHTIIESNKMFGLIRRHNLLLPGVLVGTFLVLMTMVFGVTTLISNNANQQAKLRFDSQTSQITSFISSRIDLYVNIGRGVQGLFNASEEVEEGEWDKYLQSLSVGQEYVGVSGISYAKKVSKEEISSFKYKVYPEADKEYFYPITYSTSFSTAAASTTAYGFDYSSEPARKKALDIAIENNKPTATPVVLGAISKAPLFSVYLPDYAKEASELSVEQRSEMVRGVISISFRLSEIFPQLVKNPVFTRTINVQIFDADDETKTEVLLFDTKHDEVIQQDQNLVQRTDIPVAGRTWSIRYASNIALNQLPIERYADKIVFVVGTLLSLLLTYIAYVYIRSREKALASTTLQLDTLIENFPYGVVIEDDRGGIVLLNQKSLKLLNKKAEANSLMKADVRTVVQTPGELIKDTSHYIARVEEIIESRKTVVDEKIIFEDQSTLARSYIPFFDGGVFHGAMWIYKDITEEQKIDQMKTEFVSLASHQLRTPLTSIKWYNELLAEETRKKLTKDQMGYVEEIKVATERMVDLVNSLLNVSRLELGTFSIEPEEMDLLAVVEGAVHEQEPTFKLKNQKFTYKHPKEPINLLVDKKVTHILVQNLLSNAHKYTQEKGTISLTVEKLIYQGEESVSISCADNGYGIPKEQQSRIFKKLFRADNIRTLDVEGTGLGLYIIKTVVEAAGCQIFFTSEENKGTTFTIIIPMTGMIHKQGNRALS